MPVRMRHRKCAAFPVAAHAQQTPALHPRCVLDSVYSAVFIHLQPPTPQEGRESRAHPLSSVVVGRTQNSVRACAIGDSLCAVRPPPQILRESSWVSRPHSSNPTPLSRLCPPTPTPVRCARTRDDDSLPLASLENLRCCRRVGRHFVEDALRVCTQLVRVPHLQHSAYTHTDTPP